MDLDPNNNQFFADFLTCSGFGFNIPDIIQLVYPCGSGTSLDDKAGDETWNDTFSVLSYGGTVTWGIGDLSPADVNSANFGFLLGANLPFGFYPNAYSHEHQNANDHQHTDEHAVADTYQHSASHTDPARPCFGDARLEPDPGADRERHVHAHPVDHHPHADPHPDADAGPDRHPDQPVHRNDDTLPDGDAHASRRDLDHDPYPHPNPDPGRWPQVADARADLSQEAAACPSRG